MTINGNSSISGTSGLDQANFQESRRAQPGASPVEDSTKFSVSQQQTKKLEDAVKAQPEVRADRVAAVRQSLTSNHQVSNDQIAGAIADEYSPT